MQQISCKLRLHSSLCDALLCLIILKKLALIQYKYTSKAKSLYSINSGIFPLLQLSFQIVIEISSLRSTVKLLV